MCRFVETISLNTVKPAWTKDDKVAVANKVVMNIINGDPDPIANLSDEEYGIINDGDMSKLVKPLLDEHKRLHNRSSPNNSAKTSPKRSGAAKN